MVFTFIAIQGFEVVITKTGNDHKRAQTSSKRAQTTSKQIQTISKRPETTSETTNNYPCRSNHKTDVSFLRPAPSNYKNHSNFEKHKQSMMGNCLLLSQYLCGANKIGFACFGKLRSQYSSCHQEKSTFLLIEFKQKRNCFLVF